MIYLDTSVLVAYYCPEPSSPAVERFLRRQGGGVAISDLVEIELMSAVARKARERAISRGDAMKVIALFLGHAEAGFYERFALERAHYRMARQWIGALELPLRALDALHLAVAHTHALPLATADAALARSARSLGLRVVGPGSRS